MGATETELLQNGFVEPIVLSGIKRFIGQQYDDIEPKEVQKLFGVAIVNDRGFMAFEFEPGYTYTPEFLYREFMLRPILERLAHLKRYTVLAIVQTLPATASATTKDFYSRSVMAVLKCKTCRDNKLVEYNVRGKPNPRLHFLPEPFAGLCDRAAAAQLFTVQAGAKRVILALDMGGGTTDAAVVEVAAGAAPKLLSTWGNPFLGGHDIKHKLLDIWADDNQASAQLVTTPQAAKGVFTGFEEVCATGNRVWSGSYRNKRLVSTEVHQDQVEAAVKCVLEGPLEEVVLNALKVADLKCADVTHVMLMGGTARVPYAEQLARRLFPTVPLTPADFSSSHMICRGAAMFALEHEQARAAPEQLGPLTQQLNRTELRCGWNICRRVMVRAEDLVRKVDGQLRHAVLGRDLTPQDFEDLKRQLYTQEPEKRQQLLDQITSMKAAAFDGAPAVPKRVNFEIYEPIVCADEIVPVETKVLHFYPRKSEKRLSIELYAVDPLWLRTIFIGSLQISRQKNAESISCELQVDELGRVNCTAEGKPLEVLFDRTSSQNRQQQHFWQQLSVQAVRLLDLAHRCSPVTGVDEAAEEVPQSLPLPVLLAPQRAAAAALAAAAAAKRQQRQQQQMEKQQAKRARRL